MPIECFVFSIGKFFCYFVFSQFCKDKPFKLFCQFRIMRNHHNQPVLCHFLKKIHNLDTGIAVKCPVGSSARRISGSFTSALGDSNSLHLSSGHLAWSFVKLFPKTYFFSASTARFLLSSFPIPEIQQPDPIWNFDQHQKHDHPKIISRPGNDHLV